MVLKQDGSVWSTGDNHVGQLGAGSDVATFRFVIIILISFKFFVHNV